MSKEKNNFFKLDNVIEEIEENERKLLEEENLEIQKQLELTVDQAR